MYNNLNLNNLKYFYEIANIKNITKAAENLNISQPALTKAIKQLESELNALVFIRNKKGVYLTKEGELLYEYAKTMFRDLGNTINVINDVKNDEAHLLIGATTTNFLEQILNTLRTLRKKYPKLKIELVLEDITVLEKYNKLGKLDIIIKNNYETIENYEEIKTFIIKDSFIASKESFKEIENKTLSLNEIIKYPFVLLSNNTHGRRNFDTFLKNNNIELKPTYEFNSYSLCKELIRNGFGIGIGNPIHYQTPEFIILKTDFEIPERKFNIGYIKTSKNKYINDFKEILKKED